MKYFALLKTKTNKTNSIVFSAKICANLQCYRELDDLLQNKNEVIEIKNLVLCRTDRNVNTFTILQTNFLETRVKLFQSYDNR